MAQGPVSLIDRFGVEIEVLLIFRESDLVSVLQQLGLTKAAIIKQPKPHQEVRYHLGVPSQPPFQHIAQSRPSYRGWAFKRMPTDPASWYKKTAESVRSREHNGKRTYWVEPLHLAEKVLKDRGLDVDVKVDPQDSSAYTSWRLVNDFTLIGLSPEQKRKRLKDLKLLNKRKAYHKWDTAGIELVSPPMAVDDASFAQIHKYLTALSGQNKTPRITDSKYAGLHVHIGFHQETKTQSLLHLVQHLAYILFQHELVLAKCFPPHRNADNADPKRNPDDAAIISDTDTQSNRMAIKMQLQLYGQDDIPPKDVSDAIFTAVSIDAVCDIMMHGSKTKGYRANFIPLAVATSTDPNNPKRTIEFRHHESTTDAKAIEQWVRLLVAICKAAEDKANSRVDVNNQPIIAAYSAATERSKYAVQTAADVDNLQIQDFFAFLNLDAGLQAYWQNRYNVQHEAALQEVSNAFRAPFDVPKPRDWTRETRDLDPNDTNQLPTRTRSGLN